MRDGLSLRALKRTNIAKIQAVNTDVRVEGPHFACDAVGAGRFPEAS